MGHLRERLNGTKFTLAALGFVQGGSPGAKPHCGGVALTNSPTLKTFGKRDPRAVRWKSFLRDGGKTRDSGLEKKKR